MKNIGHIDPLLDNDRETNNETTQRPARKNGSTVEVVFSMWSAPRLYHATDRVQFS
jgi:hypothetical protein